jgi:hypothetical protein
LSKAANIPDTSRHCDAKASDTGANFFLFKQESQPLTAAGLQHPIEEESTDLSPSKLTFWAESTKRDIQI